MKKPGVKDFSTSEKFNYSVIPKVDQSNLFKAVEQVLGNGGCISIFPEGGSHD